MKKELPKRQACKAWTLIPLMLCCLLTATSLRAATYTINKTTGTISIPSYSLGDTLVISGNALATADWNALRILTTGYHLELQTADVNIPANAFNLCTGILSVSSSVITNIGIGSFGNCSAMTNASFPNVTTIGNYAFQHCGVLTNASFPKATTIGEGTFYNCGALTNASFLNVTTIGDYAFQFCITLTTVFFPNATSFGGSAFGNCTALTNASFPNAPTTGYYTFQNCSALTNASFPKATTIGDGTFYNCGALTSASFPNATTIGVYAFASCSNLASLTLSNTPPALGGANAFNSVSPLLLIVPDSTTYTPVPAGFPTGSEAFNKSVPTQQSALVYGKPYDLIPNRIPTLPGGYYRWEKDGVTIPGATGSTFQATTPGLYTLQYSHGGEAIMLLSTYLAATSYDLYGRYNRYQGCENVLQLAFTQSTAARTIEVWSEGTGAASLYDTESGKYFKNTLTYKLAAGDSVLTIHYAVGDDVEDGSHAAIAYRVAPAGTTERTDQFTLYATPDIKLIKYYPTTALFKGVLDISITNSSYYIQRSLNGGQSWQFARDTITGEVLPFSENQIAGFSRDTTILFRVPAGCSYETLTIGNNNEGVPSITRQVTMPSVPDAICSVDYGVYTVNSGDNFTFTLTPTGSNAGKAPQVSTSRTQLPDSEGVVITNNSEGSYTVTILHIQEAITITIDFATGTETIDGDAVWASGNWLYLRSLVSSRASVYTIAGALVQNVSVTAGEQVTVPLNGGIYFVKLNGKTYKVMVN